jgi:hypothetical protein
MFKITFALRLQPPIQHLLMASDKKGGVAQDNNSFREGTVEQERESPPAINFGPAYHRKLVSKPETPLRTNGTNFIPQCDLALL